MNAMVEIEAALAGSSPIAKSDYLRWASSPDLVVQGRAYRLSQQHWDRITPSPDMAEQCDFMAAYLLRAIVANRTDNDAVHTGFEAGHELAAWLAHLAGTPGTRSVVTDVVSRLGQLFKTSTDDTRVRIETAMLEHALELPALRPFFQSWGADPILREAFQAARAWGEAHENGAV